jgi:hypothetical protein
VGYSERRCFTNCGHVLRAGGNARKGPAADGASFLPLGFLNFVEGCRFPSVCRSNSEPQGIVPLLQSQSRRVEPRALASHVNFIQLNGKARMCGDCELSARARPNGGTRIFD